MSTTDRFLSSQSRPEDRDRLMNELTAKVARLEEQVAELLKLVLKTCEQCHAPTVDSQLQKIGGYGDELFVCPTCADRYCY